MRYGKATVIYGLMCLHLALLGCTTNNEQTAWLDKREEVALVATDGYLPVQLQDEEGKWLPYAPKENPYEAQRGRVDKKAVVAFIAARRAFNAGDLNKAEQRLQPLLDEQENLSGPWVLSGDVAQARGALEEARRYYRKAIVVNPENVNAYLRLAHVQRRLGEYLLAQNTYAHALALWPDFPEAHLNLGVLYDVYLNHPLRAQKHMEAYQFLSDGGRAEVSDWLAELRRRTGIAPRYELAAESDRVSSSDNP